MAVLFVATASEFSVGFYCAPLSDRRAYERARSGIAQLFQTMLQTLDGGTRLGQVVRDSVRNAHFRIDEIGPEVLLTASLGCTPCQPDEENVELILNRAFAALSKSQRVGRNQLHIHDGATPVHCAAV